MTPQDLAGVLAEMKERHAEVERQLADPKIYSDRFRCRSLSRERGRLESFFQEADTVTVAGKDAPAQQAAESGSQDERVRHCG